MGCISTITHDSFPVQGPNLSVRVRVIFHFGREELAGTVVRDDAEDPGRMIIRLDDGRHVLSTECQWSYKRIEHGPSGPDDKPNRFTYKRREDAEAKQ